MSAKITQMSADPEKWLPGPGIEHRTLILDPVHQELFGDWEIMADDSEMIGDWDILQDDSEQVGDWGFADDENTYVGTSIPMPVTDDVGSYNDVEPIEMWERPNQELIGEEEIVEDEALFSGQEDTPDAGIEDNPDTVQMDEDSDSPGQSGGPSYSSPLGSTKNVTVPNPVKHFRGLLKRGDRRAIATLHQLQCKARRSPVHAHALHAIVSGGEVSMGASIHNVAGSIIKLALTPVAWATHGVGTVSKVVGNQLESLARKL